MRNKKKVLIALLTACMLSTFSVGVAACNKDKNKDSSQSSSSSEKPEVYEEAGSYYFDAVDGTYLLSLDGKECTFTVNGETKKGQYSKDGAGFKLLIGNVELVATLNGDKLTVSYNGNTYVFNKTAVYTVRYDLGDGATMNPSTVVNGKTLSKPADPVKSGYNFIGWYEDAAFTKPFAFNATAIVSDITLYARFVEDTGVNAVYTATMVVDGEEYATANTIGGVLYDLPTPTASGKTFAGWWVSDYQAADKLTYKYDGQVLAQDVKLFAVWTDAMQVSVNNKGVEWSAMAAGVEYTVKVNDAEGNLVDTRKTTALTFEFDFDNQPAGDYVITVEANGNTVTAYYKNKALARVCNFKVENSMLIFDGVANAEQYIISVDCGDEYHKHSNYNNGTSTSFNFANCAMQAGGITFVVTAAAEGYMSSVSETFVYNQQLSAVTNVAFNAESGDLTWDAVADATNYEVKVNNDKYVVSGTTLSLKGYTGNVSVTVTAMAKGYNSVSVTYTYTNAKLAAPTLCLNNGKLQWNAVAGATGYLVKINAQEFNVAANATEMAVPAEFANADYTATVQAVGDAYVSNVLNVKYAAIANLAYGDGALTWDAVGGAASYGVSVNNGDVVPVSGDANSASVVFTKAGDNTVTLYAYDSNGQALDSESVTVSADEIKFDVRGGAAVNSIYLAVGDKMALPETTMDGYQFKGWYNVPGGADSNGAKYDATVYAGEAPDMLYAYWTPNEYEVTLVTVKMVYNETTGKYDKTYETVSVETVLYKRGYQLPTVESNDQAKIFAGWYEDDSISSMKYTNENGTSTGVWSKLGGHTLYAGWIEVFNYELKEDADGKYYEVTSGAGVKMAKNITVPAQYVDAATGEAYPVWSIGSGAFKDCNMLQTLNIPDTLKYFELSWGSPWATGSALYGCWSLKDINVYCVDGDHADNANHQTYYSSVDGMLLRHASPNTDTLDHGVELLVVPFNRSGTLVVPEGVEHITTRSLYGMNFKKAIIPASVRYIGDYVFYSGAYESIIFEEAADGVDEVALEIGENTFDALDSLSELVLPTRIGMLDFNATKLLQYTPSLMNIQIVGRPTPEDAANNTYYTSLDGVVCNYNSTELVYFPKYREGEYSVPVEITKIGEKAFYNCKLSKVIMKDTVETIAKEAFLNCVDLETVEFNYKRGTLTIGERAFYGCKKLDDLVLPAQLVGLGANAFGGTKELQTVSLNAANGATIAANAFADDDGVGYVTSVSIGETVPAMEINSVFFGCKLFSLTLADGNTNYQTDAEGVLYNSDKSTILYYPYGLTTNYTIPETITKIGEGVFEGRANITSVVIPASVTEISARAFKNCVGLTSLTFAERTTNITIKANAFEGCLGLETVALPEKMTKLENDTFKNCSNLASVSIPSTITTMSFGDVFKGCDYLESVTVSEDNTAFATDNGILYKKASGNATELLFIPKGYTGAVVVPSTVSKIGASVFKGHRGVTSFSFVDDTAPTSLTLGESLFENARALTTVRLPNGLQTISAKMFMASAVETIYVPNTVKTINKQAFANCKNLTTLTFEEGNDTVGLTFTAATSATESAFSGTKNLTTVNLPARTAAISNYMFAGSYITSITIPANATSIGNYAFNGAKDLTSVVVSAKVTSIGQYAFADCENLATVDLTNATALTKIDTYAFCGGDVMTGSSINASKKTYAKNKLTSITIPATVTTIGNYAFHGCESLTEVNFAEGSVLATIGNYAFANSGITSFAMPNTVTAAGTYTFAGCTALETVTLSSSLTKIDKYMFGKVDGSSGMLNSTLAYEAAGITSIVIPASVTTIEANAFRHCAALASVTFDEACAIGYIGDNAFEASGITSFTLPENTTATTFFGRTILKDCTALKTVTLPQNIQARVYYPNPNNTAQTLSRDTAGLNNAFVGCSLTTLTFIGDGDEDYTNDVYAVDVESAFVYNGDKNTVQWYFGTASEITLEEGVIAISAYAFEGNTSLTKINLPSTLQKIDEGAFKDCTNLTTVTAPANIALNTLGERAFANSGLTSIMLPQVNSIGNYVFENCTALETVDMYGINTGNYMFKGCTALTAVNFHTKQDILLRDYMFEGCTALESFTFPTKVVTVTEGEGEEAVEVTKTVAAVGYIGKRVFYRSGLTSITLPAGLPLQTTDSSNGSGANMFEECANLATVTMDDSYTFLPYQFFYNAGLTSFTLPKSMKAFGTNAMTNCANLATLIIPEEVKDLQLGMSAFCGLAVTSIDLSHVTNLTWVWDSTFSKNEGYVFAKNPNLTTVMLPDCVTELPEYTFQNCSALTTVVANNIQIVGKNAFDGCTSLSSFTMSEDGTEIRDYAFNKCKALTSFVVPEGVTTIAQYAFYQSGLQTIDLGNVQTIGASAFNGSALTSMTIPASMQTITAGAFRNCANLEKFEVEAGSGFSVGDYGELYNSFNQLVVFPRMATVENGRAVLKAGTSLEETYAMEGCTNVTAVVLSDATTKIPEGTFSGSGITRIEIPANVTEIGASAFAKCEALVEVVLPETVTKIGTSAFNSCTALTTINLPRNLATISGSTFKGCTALENIKLPANLTTIEASAFADSGLTAISFPAKLSTIKASAFKGTKLTSVVIPATVTVLGDKPSSSSGGGGGGFKPFPIFSPVKALVFPGLPDVGGGSTTTTTTDGPGAVFADCLELRSVKFEGTLEFCGKEMFKGCTALEEVILPNGWDEIKESMFNGCTNMKNFEIPETVSVVQKDAFNGWTAEQTITIHMTLAQANAVWGDGWNGDAKVVTK